jgi:hypothetical protein
LEPTAPLTKMRVTTIALPASSHTSPAEGLTYNRASHVPDIDDRVWTVHYCSFFTKHLQRQNNHDDFCRNTSPQFSDLRIINENESAISSEMREGTDAKYPLSYVPDVVSVL